MSNLVVKLVSYLYFRFGNPVLDVYYPEKHKKVLLSGINLYKKYPLRRGAIAVYVKEGEVHLINDKKTLNNIKPWQI